MLIPISTPTIAELPQLCLPQPYPSTSKHISAVPSLTYNRSQGFSLLETLLVVALVGVLASYAVPAYQGYMQETRFLEVVQHTQAVRISQAACLMESGNDVAACDTFTELALVSPNSTDNIASVAIAASTGALTGTGTSASGSYTYILTPSISTSGQVDYAKTGTCVAAKVC